MQQFLPHLACADEPRTCPSATSRAGLRSTGGTGALPRFMSEGPGALPRSKLPLCSRRIDRHAANWERTGGNDLNARRRTSQSDPGPPGRLRGLLAAGARPDSAATRHLFTVHRLPWRRGAALAGIDGRHALPRAVPDLGRTACDRWRRSRCLLGWLVLGLAGGIYYLLPRLTGASLQAEGLANLALAASAGTFADRHRAGRDSALATAGSPSRFPGGGTCPVLGVLSVPAVVTMRSLGRTARVDGLSVALVHDRRGHLASGSVSGRQPARPQVTCDRSRGPRLHGRVSCMSGR